MSAHICPHVAVLSLTEAITTSPRSADQLIVRIIPFVLGPYRAVHIALMHHMTSIRTVRRSSLHTLPCVSEHISLGLAKLSISVHPGLHCSDHAVLCLALSHLALQFSAPLLNLFRSSLSMVLERSNRCYAGQSMLVTAFQCTSLHIKMVLLGLLRAVRNVASSVSHEASPSRSPLWSILSNSPRYYADHIRSNSAQLFSSALYSPPE